MRLEPVYVVAPRKSRALSRRAFIATACGSLAAGLCGGFALWGGPASASGPADPIVLWAREASADPARIDELVRHYHGFLHALASEPEDPILWGGFDRMVDRLEQLGQREVETGLAAASLRQALRARPPDAATAADWDRRLRALEKR